MSTVVCNELNDSTLLYESHLNKWCGRLCTRGPRDLTLHHESHSVKGCRHSCLWQVMKLNFTLRKSYNQETRPRGSMSNAWGLKLSNDCYRHYLQRVKWLNFDKGCAQPRYNGWRLNLAIGSWRHARLNSNALLHRFRRDSSIMWKGRCNWYTWQHCYLDVRDKARPCKLIGRLSLIA